MSNLLNPNAAGSVADFLANAPDMEPVAEETPEAEDAEAAPEPVDPIDALLMDFEGLPGRDVIEMWKERFGGVHAFVPNNSEVYLFRPLQRLQYTTIAKDLARLRQSASAEEDPTVVENMTHEKVVTACLLHPRELISPDKMNFCPAGLFSTLFELIMRNSHFLNPEVAMQSCYRL